MASKRKTRAGRSRAARRSPSAHKTKARKKKSSRRKAARSKSTGPRKAAHSKKGARPARKAPARPPRVRAFRLTPDVRPSQVDLHVEVDPSRGQRFRGEVRIDLELARPQRKLELHAAELEVSRPRLVVAGVERRGRLVAHPERQTIEIQFDQPIPAGPARLELHFAGKLRKDLCGLYGASVGERQYAFSQLEAAEARKFFPCFDEPAMKARFRLTVTTGGENTALSNGPIERVEAHADGRKTVHFARTPPLSTYLVALAVGELECSEAVFVGPTEIRVWHVPGKAGLSDHALEMARESLTRLEAYFDLPYPYAKLDLVAVPDFEFGAMENAGAVFFRETLLLMDSATVTLAEQKRAAEVICHELAHMWYGNLVTMAWWDDLWLNEAFATWMAFAIIDEWKPEWEMWLDFLHHRAAALDLDSLSHTHPIYATVRTPEDVNANFDLITYEKGASVVRMIERYLTPLIFRAGVRRYIRRHSESNTVAADLWNTLSEASGEPVEPIVRAWIEQEGYPVVRVRRVEGTGGRELELHQERFFQRPPKTSRTRQAKRTVGTIWPVPWVGSFGGGAERGQGQALTQRHLLTKRRERVAGPAGSWRFVYGNADEGGFFRPHHAAGELRDLLEHLPALSALERLGLVDHQWALVRADRAPLGSVLELVAALADEPDPDVLMALRRPLAHLATRLAPDHSEQVEEDLCAWIEARFGPALDELGWGPAPGESDRTRLRRAALLGIVGEVGRSRAVVEAASKRCERYLVDRSSLDPNLADAVVAIAASRGKAALYDDFLAAMRTARTPQEQRRFLLALGDFEVPGLIRRSQALVLSQDVATQDVVFLLVRMLTNRAGRESTWAFIQRRFAALKRRMPPLLASRLIEATPALGTPRYRREVARFFRTHPLPAGERTLRQALERFDWYAAFRRRAGPALTRYLKG
ncbi:MAG: M1 family aminopeptidase [Myxococcota bacterium]